MSAPKTSNSSATSTTDSKDGEDGIASNRHAQQLRQFNQDELLRRHVLTDVDLVLDGDTVRAHRALLVCFSPYLRKKLVDTDGKSIVNKVHIPKVGKKEFDILLQYMYTGNLKITFVNFLEIYKAASILEMREVMQDCIQLLETSDDIKTYFYLYVISKKLGIGSHWLQCLKLLTHRFEEVVCTAEFLKLPVDYIFELLSAQSIGARSEVIVFLAALKWLNHKYGKRSKNELRLMECVRFSSMSMEEIVACYHPPFLPQVVDNPKIVTILFRATCYITAKFLGKESNFKAFESQKRNLTFENLPLELWKSSPKKSALDVALRWKDTIERKFPTNPIKTEERSFRYQKGNQDSTVVPDDYLSDALTQIIQLSSSDVDNFETVNKSPNKVATTKHKSLVRALPSISFGKASETNILHKKLHEAEAHTIEDKNLDTESKNEAKQNSDFTLQMDSFTHEDINGTTNKYDEIEMLDTHETKSLLEDYPSKKTTSGSKRRQSKGWFFRK